MTIFLAVIEFWLALMVVAIGAAVTWFVPFGWAIWALAAPAAAVLVLFGYDILTGDHT